MRIEEIMDLQSVANKTQTDALNNQAKQLKVKKAKLAADKARQQATKAQQRVQKVQAHQRIRSTLEAAQDRTPVVSVRLLVFLYELTLL